MQSKLGIAFMVVTLLYVLCDRLIPRLQLDPFHASLLSVSAYLVIGLGASWVVSRMLTRRLRVLADVASLISQGDLTRRIDTTGNDETADLARSLALMTQGLLNVVLEVQDTADRINVSAQELATATDGIRSATQDIADTAEEIARGAEGQARKVHTTTDTTRELTQAVERVNSRARAVHASASDAAERAAAGAQDARRAAEAIGSLHAQTASASAAVEGFREKATRIGDIVGSITSLSRQTHVLAINAAIEAARAGEDGRGFGVVAEEVSRLADDVRCFAEQISTISDEINRGASRVTDEIGRSSGVVASVHREVERGMDSFEGIVEAIHGTVERAHEISELSERQQFAALEVSHALEEISGIAQRNASGTEEASASASAQNESMRTIAESSTSLAATSDQLRELIAIFKLR